MPLEKWSVAPIIDIILLKIESQTSWDQGPNKLHSSDGVSDVVREQTTQISNETLNAQSHINALKTIFYPPKRHALIIIVQLWCQENYSLTSLRFKFSLPIVIIKL